MPEAAPSLHACLPARHTVGDQFVLALRDVELVLSCDVARKPAGAKDIQDATEPHDGTLGMRVGGEPMIVRADRAGAPAWRGCLRVSEDPLNPIAEPSPGLLLELQLPLAGRRNAIESRLPILLRRPPLGLDPARLLHAVQRRVERPLFHS